MSDDISVVFAALSDPTRRRLFEQIRSEVSGESKPQTELCSQARAEIA